MLSLNIITGPSIASSPDLKKRVSSPTALTAAAKRDDEGTLDAYKPNDTILPTSAKRPGENLDSGKARAF